VDEPVTDGIDRHAFVCGDRDDRLSCQGMRGRVELLFLTRPVPLPVHEGTRLGLCRHIADLAGDDDHVWLAFVSPVAFESLRGAAAVEDEDVQMRLSCSVPRAAPRFGLPARGAGLVAASSSSRLSAIMPGNTEMSGTVSLQPFKPKYTAPQ